MAGASANDSPTHGDSETTSKPVLTARGVKRRCSQLAAARRMSDAPTCEYAGMRAGGRYCAAHSEHESDTDRNTVNTVECSGSRRSPCPLERWFGHMNTYSSRPASRARRRGRGPPPSTRLLLSSLLLIIVETLAREVHLRVRVVRGAVRVGAYWIRVRVW